MIMSQLKFIKIINIYKPINLLIAAFVSLFWCVRTILELTKFT